MLIFAFVCFAASTPVVRGRVAIHELLAVGLREIVALEVSLRGKGLVSAATCAREAVLSCNVTLETARIQILPRAELTLEKGNWEHCSLPCFTMHIRLSLGAFEIILSPRDRGQRACRCSKRCCRHKRYLGRFRRKMFAWVRRVCRRSCRGRIIAFVVQAPSSRLTD